MGWGWIKRIGGIFKFAKPIVGIALPGLSQAIFYVEEIATMFKEKGGGGIESQIKEDMAIWKLAKLIDDQYLGDKLTDEQERLARQAVQANVAFANSLRDGHPDADDPE
jgi:hypothetical protein